LGGLLSTLVVAGLIFLFVYLWLKEKELKNDCYEANNWKPDPTATTSS
jgi:hypothetical protein